MKTILDKKTMKEFLKYESRNYKLKTTMYPLICLNESALLYRCNYLLRHQEYYYNCNKKLRYYLFKFLMVKYREKYFINIPINVFDKGLKMIHLGPRLVNGGANIGKNCVLHINTAIVAGGTNNDAPTIGDNCIMSVGSTVLGKSVLGDNIVIAAGAVVNKSFLEGNMTIGGIPSKKISNNTGESWNNLNKKNNI